MVASDLRFAACVQHNVVQSDARTATIATFRALVDGDLTVDEQIIYDRVVTTATAGYPYRDCSPVGIAAYFADPPPDPALEEK
jgi:hypothetical protein